MSGSATSARIAAVTGGSGGIGMAAAETLAREGYRLLLIARDTDRMEAAATTLRSTGAAVDTTLCDVTRLDEVTAAFDRIRATFGQLDLLVHAAGTTPSPQLVARAHPDYWDEVLRSNLTAAALCCRGALSLMRRRREGRIVLIGSTAGRDGAEGLAAYSAAKEGLAGLASSVREEVRRHGIRVTLIRAAAVATGVYGAGRDTSRMLRPADVAEAVAFVTRLSPQAHVAELALEMSVSPVDSHGRPAADEENGS